MALAQGFVEREGAVGRARDRDAVDRRGRHERGERLVVAQLSARLGVEVDGRRPSAREQQCVGRERPAAGADALDAVRADDALDLDVARRFELRLRGVRPRIENLDLRPGFGERFGDRIGRIVVRRDRDALAHHDSEAAEIDERRVGRHHARPVVVGNGERPLDRAGGDDDALRPDAPERVGARGAPLPGADEIVVVDSERGRRRQDASAGRFDRGADVFRPFAPVAAFDRSAAMDELAADVVMILDKEHDLAGPCGRARRGEAGRTRADDEQVAAGVDLRAFGRRAIVGVDDSEAGHGAHQRLERLPARPDEGLVVEARGHEGGEPVDQRGAIVRGGRRRIDRAHGKIVVERFGRGAEVRRRAAGARHIDDRVRLLGPGAPDSARPVIFEAAADDADAAGEQRRGDAVALEPDERLAVEGEGERLAAVDRAAFGEAEGGHGPPLRGSAADHRVGRRVARHGEGFHAGPMQPDFAGFALRIGVEIEIVGPVGVAHRLGRLGPGLRLADIVEFGLVARPAERTGEDLHGEASSGSPRSVIVVR